MGGASHLEEYRGLQSGELTQARNVQRRGFSNLVELDLLLEPVARNIRLYGRNHTLDGCFNLRRIDCGGEHIHGVAHRDGRFRRIEHDNCLSFRSAANEFDGLRSGFSEFIDVGACSGTRRFAADGGNNLRVVYRRHPGDRGNDWNGCLSAARHHVYIELKKVLIQIYNRHTVWPDCRGSQIDHAKLRLDCAQKRIAADVRPGARRVEHNVNVRKLGQARQCFHSPVGGGDAQTRRASQAVRVRINADQGGHSQASTVAQNLDHQVGSDIAGANDGRVDWFTAFHSLSPHRRRL